MADPTERRGLPYLLVCVALGLVLGWVPGLLHGPIAEKFNVLFIRGAIAVWAWRIARLSVGLWIGISVWPRPWWLRGPLCGLLAILPLCLVSIATPGCGWPCAGLNAASATTLGLVVAGGVRLVTGRDHA